MHLNAASKSVVSWCVPDVARADHQLIIAAHAHTVASNILRAVTYHACNHILQHSGVAAS